jgi:hypothetical protein
MKLSKIDVGQKPCAFDDIVETTGVSTYQDFPKVGGRCPHLPHVRGQESLSDRISSRRVGACLPPSQRQGQALPLREVTAKVLIKTEAEMWLDQTYETTSGFLTVHKNVIPAKAGIQ